MTTDIASALLSKSDQLNASDLIGGPIIIEITKVTNLGKGKEQPLIINYKGDDGKPWKACKSMGRVMAKAWRTTDGSTWIGRFVRLYCDETVTFGKEQPGGIRICHTESLSHISEPMDLDIPKTRGKTIKYHIEPLIFSLEPNVDEFEDKILKADFELLPLLWSEAQKLFKNSTNFARIHAAKEKRKAELNTPKDNTSATHKEVQEDNGSL